ncbi:MAG TPA: sigma-70 family RNA polymerase sigma factor [Marmoricola sp.]|nr:sigma-70 family RNA polymerase sigma factor [Marmoricola sp.]
MSESAFEELFRRTAPEVHAYLRRRIGAESEDLLGEVFVIAWNRRRDLPRPELHRAWLFGVARRLVLVHLRKQRQSNQAAVDLARQGVLASSADPERDSVVLRAMEALPERDRELIRLTIWEGLTTAEAAVAVAMRPGAARVRLHRARRRLANDPSIRGLMTRDRRPNHAPL